MIRTGSLVRTLNAGGCWACSSQHGVPIWYEVNPGMAFLVLAPFLPTCNSFTMMVLLPGTRTGFVCPQWVKELEP